jgi:negative regulator of flagellin synthesis FlgM
MNSKIDGLPSPLPRPSVSSVAAASVAGTGKGGRAEAAAADSVQLSGDTVDIVALAKQLGSAPSIDAAKVASVRAALESGTYRIDAQEIARRLVQLERELGV